MRSKAIDAVIAAIVENRSRFEAFCYSLSPEELMRAVPDSSWFVRDFAAHLGTLDTALVRWFEAAAGGMPVDSSRDADGAAFDVDQFNDDHVVERRGWPLERIFAEARANRERLIAALEKLSDEDIDQTMHFAADAKRKAGDLPLKLFLAGWAQHDPIHVADMVKALPDRADDAEVVAWLNNPFVSGYQAVMRGPARA